MASSFTFPTGKCDSRSDASRSSQTGPAVTPNSKSCLMPSPLTLSATELLSAYRTKALSPVEVLTACFDRIDRFEPKVNAFVLQDRDGALKAAETSERRWLRREALGPGDGIPATVKDNIAWSGHPNRQGSCLTSKQPVDFDAPAVARLKEAGCVLLGKTTMPEFGWKGVGDSPLTGITRNPWHLERTSGGSSSGAAVAAALGMGVFHLGTDAAGSVRIPASFTGVVGLKPSYGRVPSFPPSVMGGLAHIGPLTRTVTDAAHLLSIIAQPDSRDPTAWNVPAPDYRWGLDGGIKGLRVAWSPTLGFATQIDPDVAHVTAYAARAFADLGAIVDEVDPGLADPIDILTTLWTAGAALALRAYEPDSWSLCDAGLVQSAQRGVSVSGADVVEALTRKRLALSNHLDALFSKYDLLLTPQMPTAAIPVGSDMPPPGFAGVEDWGANWTNWSPFTYPINIAQLPAISVPCGFTRDGLPVGLQIVGPLRSDALVLRAARAFEALNPITTLDTAAAISAAAVDCNEAPCRRGSLSVAAQVHGGVECQED